jgi:DNA-binding NtrC family response regulator
MSNDPSSPWSPQNTVTAHPREGAAAAAGPDRAYLLVFELETTRLVRLPTLGELVVGRGEDAGLPLSSSSVSRRHARFEVREVGAWVADLGSHNGTVVNGERIEGCARLCSGDVISLGEVTIAYHAGAAGARRAVLDGEGLRQRLVEEVVRAMAHGRPLTLLCARTAPDVDRLAVSASLSEALRPTDVAGLDAPGELAVILLETTRETGREVARRIATALGTARVGVASCPGDGSDADTLLASARSAARVGAAGAVAEPPASFEVVAVGDREVVIADATMSRIYALVRRLAAAELPVLVHGETGSGKDLAAAALHHWSPRAARPLVALNCAALQDGLVESELFGFARGAFTGAAAAKPGLLESGAGGTVFLDEVGELSAATQAKLLRVLETKKATRLGEVRERDIDIRIVAATNRDLEEDVRQGRFRADLFYRLGAATIWLPPLRDRPRELRVLADRFLRSACARAGREPLGLSDSALRVLATHGWPGNVRELRNAMDYLAATVGGPVVEDVHLPERLVRRTAAEPAGEAAPMATFRPIEEELREIEQRRMADALEASAGNHARAAGLIRMPVRTFYTKAKLYGLGRKEGD